MRLQKRNKKEAEDIEGTNPKWGDILWDNIADEEDLKDIAMARKELAEGNYAKWEDIDWD